MIWYIISKAPSARSQARKFDLKGKTIGKLNKQNCLYFYQTVFAYDKLIKARIWNPIRCKYIFCVKLNTAVSKQWHGYSILKGMDIWLWMKTQGEWEICTESGNLPKNYYSKTCNFWKHCTLLESCTKIVCSRPTVLSFSLFASFYKMCCVLQDQNLLYHTHFWHLKPNKNLTTVQHVVLTHYWTLKAKA